MASNKQKTAPATSNGAQEKPKGGLPLFYTTPSVLDATRHAKSTVSSTNDYAFARGTNSVTLNSIEFIEAARYYPIVFASDEAALPAVVLGLEQSNYFVNADGTWREDHYIPAYIRQFPFIFFEQPSEERFYLCIDEAAPNFHLDGAAEGAPLYDAEGKPTPLSNHALEFCTAYYQHHSITQNMCADLVKHALLTPFHSEAKLANGTTLNLGGFQMIDEAAFNKLPDETFLEFRKKGWLAFIYFALASTANWKRLIDLAN